MHLSLTERYIYAVKKRLPDSQKEDIEKELRGLIEDMIEEQGGYSKETEERVLLQLGNPRLLAEKYADKANYLIGPEFFELYLTIVKIVVTIATILAVLGTIIESATKSYSIINTFASVIGSAINAAIGSFGIVTIIFALNERIAKKELLKEIEKEWSIKDLPDVKNVSKPFSRAGTIAGIVFIAIFMMVFNNYYHLTGIYFSSNSVNRFIPILNSDVFKTYLPLINIIFLLHLLFNFSKFIFTKWSYPMATANLVMNIISLIIFLYILKDNRIINIEFLNNLKNLTEEGSDVNPGLYNIIKNVIFSLVPLFMLIDISEGFYNAYRNKNT